MSFRFTILNNRTEVATAIDEPVGWDKYKQKIGRDLDWHGIFFSNGGDTFEYHGEAGKILKAEYEQYGSQGDMSLVIDEDCGLGYDEYDSGKFNFLDYGDFDDKGCYVKCPVESTDETMTIRNRMDQKVNLETDKAFDESTVLTPYAALPMQLLMPSKGIFIQDDFRNENSFSTPVDGVPLNNNPGSTPSSFNSQYGMIEIGFDKMVAAEIGNASTLTQARYNCVLTSAGYLGCASLDRFILGGSATAYVSPLDITPYVNFQAGTLNYEAVDNPCSLDVLINGNVEVLAGTINAVWFVLAVLPKDKVGNADADYIYLQKTMIYEVFGSPGLPPGTILPLNVAYSNAGFNLQKGDRIYCYYHIYHRRQNSSISAGGPGFNLTFDAGNYFKLTDISHTPATLSNVFAVNEALSRVTEAITDNKVRAYSEFYGRTDSEPYSHPADGCGSMKVITDGLRIRRQENKIPGQTTPYTVSLKDLFEGLNPIDNIGIGLEDDTNRVGYKRLRVEDWRYFYNQNVIMQCAGVNKIKRQVYAKEIYSIFKFGYQKWEAEEYNGLDEFLTKREGRTTLKQVNNTLTKLSSMIASGYALEITRRIGNLDSKDWRYDKESFILCTTRTRKYHVKFYTATNSMVFETDTNGTEFLVATITIAGSISNNGTRTILSTSIYSGGPGIPAVITITFTGGVTIDEESYNVTFPGIVSPSGIFVELGNVINDANIIEPETIYNYRISPIRNAMRWMNRVLESYRQFDANAKLIFTNGDGNIFAEGELESAICKLENGPIAENDTINATIFSDSDAAKPFLRPERLTYEYPFNGCDLKAVKANPYGLIYYETECESGYGYIDNILARPDEGLANFNLIPAITDLPNPNPYKRIITEDGIDIITEDGDFLITEN